jgi:hypothetical protein
MPFVTTPDRFAMEKGMLQLIEDLLRAKFGEEGCKLMPQISDLEDADKFRMVHIDITNATTLDEVRRACAAAAAPPGPHKKNKRGKQ